VERGRLRTVSGRAVRQTASGPEVLLLRRTAEHGGFWQPVTGRRQEGERADAAARRELEEETGQGLPVRGLRYRHTFAFGDASPPMLVHEEAFAADWPGDVPVRIGPEHDAAEWVTVEEALGRVPHPGLRRAIRRAVSVEGGPDWRDRGTIDPVLRPIRSLDSVTACGTRGPAPGAHASSEGLGSAGTSLARPLRPGQPCKSFASRCEGSGTAPASRSS
jgi:ADP-ribose pyrophosphatase YjhB (NUDIX family)